jgi:hypothetical protein
MFCDLINVWVMHFATEDFAYCMETWKLTKNLENENNFWEANKVSVDVLILNKKKILAVLCSWRYAHIFAQIWFQAGFLMMWIQNPLEIHVICNFYALLDKQ